MAEKNKLSIYLVKDEFSTSDQSILKNGAEMLAELENVGSVYYLPSQTHVPSWVNSFFAAAWEMLEFSPQTLVLFSSPE